MHTQHYSEESHYFSHTADPGVLLLLCLLACGRAAYDSRHVPGHPAALTGATLHCALCQN